MVEMEPIENIVKRDRIASAKRPELKRPTGQLNQIGNHFYAYSGSYPASTTTVTALDFVTSNKYYVGVVELFAGTKLTDPASGAQTCAEVKFNDHVITVLKGSSKYPTEGGQGGDKGTLIIPPNTRVRVRLDSAEDTALELCHVNITGTVHNS